MSNNVLIAQVCIWDPTTGKQQGHTLIGHKQWITWLAWQPLHMYESLHQTFRNFNTNLVLCFVYRNPECRLLASASKDGTIRIWDVMLYKATLILSGHTHCVTCVRWGGEGLLYTSSQDRTIKVWRAKDVSLRYAIDKPNMYFMFTPNIL